MSDLREQIARAIASVHLRAHPEIAQYKGYSPAQYLSEADAVLALIKEKVESLAGKWESHEHLIAEPCSDCRRADELRAAFEVAEKTEGEA